MNQDIPEIEVGKLYVVRKQTHYVVFSDKQDIKVSKLCRGSILLALSKPFKRSFLNDIKVPKRYSLNKNHKLMWSTKFLFEDKAVELASLKYWIRQDYIAELSHTIKILRRPSDANYFR